MPYYQAKVYFDGSHYIGIPHTERPCRRTLPPPEEIIEVPEESTEITEEADANTALPFDLENDEFEDENSNTNENQEDTEKPVEQSEIKPKTRKTTRKELFEELYRETISLKKSKRREIMIKKLRPYFYNDEKTEKYVDEQLERKLRNLICRRIRMCRKAYLQRFNYFCTFTYDDKKHTEESFKQLLKRKLNTFSTRKGWKYIGVWERGQKTSRLHFHGMFYIPPGTLPEEILPIRDYDTRKGQMQITYQSTYFNAHFGRSDFKVIDDTRTLCEAMAYIMKYIEKSGEKIIYSKGLPQYFISDILEDDVVCNIGLEDRKLLLFDNFSCWRDGEYIGEVSPEVIKQLKTSNV